MLQRYLSAYFEVINGAPAELNRQLAKRVINFAKASQELFLTAT
jgi:hypothetical protein